MSMNITRSEAVTERSDALVQRIAGLGTPCVGCTNCRGLCRELIEAIVVPEIILRPAQGH
ncbi:hypothetical protein RXV86_08320 [Alisedimentitalea sp. MJ-SS2]|uniref:hypothetical protein n=1 Tax=Aliisedimentitalea sp. MJ-SS2 TaxID=3049795 RepID=UPI00290E42E3|nr:hypothetical protein [Alisedimentitalea sp. MJ-SS2]MDU8927385.1 hypothetical protein [Alisedimentitalea sp. MJ-SS2]